MLQIKNVNLNVGNTALLSNINLTLEQGKNYGVLGPNGAGKTTLFKSMLGLTDFSGEILSDGQPVSSRCFGSLIEYPAFYSRLTVEENLNLHAQYLGLKQPNIEAALKQVNLLDARKKLFSQLSLGMRQRLGIARAFLGDVQYLLLDEPTNHLDIASREALESALQGYEGTLFVISHDRYLINKIADRVYYLEPGGAEEYQGNYDAFLEKRRQEEEPEKGVKPVPKQNDYKLRKQKESELRKLKTRVRRAEEEIDGLDRETAELAGRLSDPETASDYEKALELTQRMEELRARQEKLMESWEALCQELEEKEAR